MKSIREYNTSGMDLSERNALLTKVIPVQIGEFVWDAGDYWSYPELVKVTKDNQKQITMFWNSLYFDKEEDANRKNQRARMAYGSYLSGSF